MVINVEMYKEVRSRWLNGESQRHIAAAMGISRNTVKKYCKGDTVPWERKAYFRDANVLTAEVKRFIELRLKKNVSQREMSLALGQNDSYINRIENGKALPSMQVFLYICEYFHVTPKEFFDMENADPERLRPIIENMKRLDGPALAAMDTLAKELAGKQS